tara:strand:- start:107 stop:232 length:126 start_codon:yes stop_codon:yes gene_type:complete
MKKKIIKIIAVFLIGILTLLYVGNNIKAKGTRLRKESTIGV